MTTAKDILSRGGSVTTEKAARTVMDESYGAVLEEKWGYFVDGIGDPYKRRVLAILAENAWMRFMRGKSGGVMTENVTRADVGEYQKHIFPVIRRVYANMVGMELVSVQPMTGPVGAVFFKNTRYGLTKGETAAGTIVQENVDANYTSSRVLNEKIATPNGTDFGGAGAALSVTLKFAPVFPLNAEKGYSVVVEDVDADGTVVQTATDNGTGGFTGDVLSGTINYATGYISNFKFTNAPTAGAGRRIVVSYYYNMEANRNIPSVKFDISVSAVEAVPRKLKYEWTVESADALKAMHGLIAETELTRDASNQIMLELDREILNDLLAAGAGITRTFDFTVPAGVDPLSHIREVLTAIGEVSALIHTRTLRGRANFLVTNPLIISRLQQLQTHGDYRPLWVSSKENPYGPFDGTVRDPSYDLNNSDFGVSRVGAIQNKMLLYSAPEFAANKILVGLKGNGFLDAGYAYMPFIPLEVVGPWLNPETQEYVASLRMLYAKKLLNENYYGQVVITGGI